MKIINNLFRLIHRKRHSAGFGVHSPFAFNLILDTIHSPHSYYTFEDITIKLHNAGLLEKADTKYAELIFRLINRFNSKVILEIGSGIGINSLYISAHSKQTSVTCVEKDDEKSKIAKTLLANKSENILFTNVLPTKENTFDAIVWDLNKYSLSGEKTTDTISSLVKSGGFVVIKHINKNKQTREVWERTLKLDKLTMSFDLGAIGIGFFKPSLPRLNYDLCF